MDVSSGDDWAFGALKSTDSAATAQQRRKDVGGGTPTHAAGSATELKRQLSQVLNQRVSDLSTAAFVGLNP